MSGRGFLKSRLAQVAPKQPEEPAKPEEPPKLAALPPTDIPKIPIASTSPQTLVAGNQQVARGRRAMLANIAQGISSPKLCDDVSTKFSNIDLGSVKDIVRPTISPEHKKAEESTLLKQPQTQIVDIPAAKEEKSPVICRVLKNSEKDTYQMTQLSSNYIRIKLEEDKGIYEYRVDFNPPVDAKSARFFLLNEHKDLFPVKTFDGTVLYIPKMLPQNVTTLVGRLRDESEVTLTITFKRKNLLRECIHFYNVFLRTIMKILGLVEFGRSCYDQNKRILIPEFKLEVWPGYITTIDEFENGLYMCAEVSHRVLRVQTVLQIMTDLMMNSKNTNTDSKQEIMAALCGSTVITHYNRKTYRVDDVDFTMNPLSTFDQNGVEVTYKDYYKKMYDVEIKNLQQPMLITKPKKKDINSKKVNDLGICCLVPELCNLTGLTDAMKSDFKLMKALQQHTLVTPEVRQNAIIEFVNRINGHEVASKKFRDWGLMMRPVPVKMEGPVYKRETILLGNNIRKQVGMNMDWGMDVAKNAMFVAVNMFNWAILYNPKDESTAKSFCKQLAICGRPLGMDINPPKPIKVNGTTPEVFVSTVNNTVKNNPEIQLVVIIFPNQREDRYNAVKRICCSEIGIPSQVIISRTLAKPERLQSITQKIALQINCKLGGACWAVDIPLKNTMIVGIDVYHEKGKQMSSVVGFVASMDKTFTEWYSVAAMQRSTHQELMKSVQDAFHKVVIQFKAKNGLLPEKIIIYRDGVSDGDLKQVEEIELSDLIESFKSYPGNYNPMVSLIIVQKRINTRVFQYVNEKYSNPSPGTVIDSTVTRRNYFDFFLVSQHVRQGTVNPTHYIVLKNGCNLSVENVQRLSYKLCHLYYNWCGTVKVPAPVQYAHKLAYLIGQNVRQMPSDGLCNSLFFL
ncbi:PREDICTED: protein argonaute-3-like [Diuraphis noxia]|uniref:protein argonaute-3-like n=1 Tax=Diuraphis noxia TaxID=143948 RepID=UPI00076382F1|nr:PREDICTED: protein argonaute-3-like [Diuraphis noxia]XP_015367178.1 PREDICTED: protein argonaute-3-like [Diuraphis noxia]XP_015367179.1 PREDICTED: protein argonaute-3-like [Diuraphis noxia]XP_015367180.1 PREDICTED: protein argonaute-3-like [Diuraphis noxia]XP_015367181.1 PREDICTED: protein argonaute-3-like [Diuraphis noxia]